MIKNLYAIKEQDKIKLAHQGYGLDILIKDASSLVRIAVLSHGYGLDILKNDKCWMIRHYAKEEIERLYSLNELEKEELICQGKHLDIFIKDSSWLVRIYVARQGYGLDILIKDKNYIVRYEVAIQGYGLDILVNDPSRMVCRGVREFKKTMIENSYTHNEQDKIKLIQESKHLDIKDASSLVRIAVNKQEGETMIEQLIRRRVSKIIEAGGIAEHMFKGPICDGVINNNFITETLLTGPILHNLYVLGAPLKLIVENDNTFLTTLLQIAETTDDGEILHLLVTNHNATLAVRRAVSKNKNINNETLKLLRNREDLEIQDNLNKEVVTIRILRNGEVKVEVIDE